MENPTITGVMLNQMFQAAAQAIETQAAQVNALNVFPVPDGDTGSNMSRTMGACAHALAAVDADAGAGEVARAAATALLRGARGNSGVILSLLVRGMALALRGKEAATAADWAGALQSGVDAAYKAVMKPAEGTILTVAREAAVAAAFGANNGEDMHAVFLATVEQAKDTLARTPDMLPVLKKAGVVDSGGQGLVIILSAMLDVLEGKAAAAEPEQDVPPEHDAAASAEDESAYAYCTEFIINKRKNVATKDSLALRAFLESLGDCVLVADDEDFIKVHCHTDHPGKAIEEALTFGFLTDLKIDNMHEQHREKADSEPLKAIGFVAVASGKGVAAVFRDLGVDAVVEGGQTMNPSTEDILKAVEGVAAQTVFILPNNKNILMAAEQAAALSAGKARVLHTKTIPQGMTAMLAYLPDADAEQNLLAMESAYGKVHTGLVTYAVRDTEFDGKRIHKGEILALEEGHISFTDGDTMRAAVRLLRDLADKSTAFITILYGEGVNAAQAETVRAEIAGRFPQAEVNVINGGQPIYSFILSVE
ncbi:DAK2 domain-containing protein [Ethanoligenens harbinense]|uniref:DAK2 domain fusion protein YloV n=1 Tax=Ethanoligenens harbinense (strain DSM 18485 / JCM 12961 / CGMCC 1.5033 / YUAN-3) TaxID=663278 RepID=E6U6Q7_ETHHY|nr:DAK2 domain-containing protein [Ethanoligenens harbinense]ADU25790.1 DAK2 domain fusion protein YloV [Ethanoligenens harbinense YUAN-3]